MHQEISRRRFVQVAAVAGSALSLGKGLRSVLGPTEISPGLQLWSVRDALSKDPAAAVKSLAKMGYRKVEGFGMDSGKMFGLSVADFIKIVKDNGMKMPSTHCKFTLADYDAGKKMLSDTAKKTIDLAVSQGVKYVINPWLDEKERGQIDQLVPVYQAAAAYAKKAGGKFAYHNHDFEFTKKGPDGRLLIEWILHETDPALVDMEMDMYWVVFAGYNPVDWFERYPGRWKLCHVKDLASTAARESIEVGEGTIDFNAIFKHRKKAGLEHFVIELEHYRTNSMDGVDLCRKNFRKLRFG
jgi:sugar phosphate isomerase/epimerase